VRFLIVACFGLHILTKLLKPGLLFTFKLKIRLNLMILLIVLLKLIGEIKISLLQLFNQILKRRRFLFQLIPFPSQLNLHLLKLLSKLLPLSLVQILRRLQLLILVLQNKIIMLSLLLCRLKCLYFVL